MHGRQELNPQPTVLETVALPIELRPFMRKIEHLPKRKEDAQFFANPNLATKIAAMPVMKINPKSQ